MIVCNEKEYAEDCLENGYGGSNLIPTLNIIAKYYYYYQKIPKKQIGSLLFDFLDEYYPKYELKKYTWQNTIEKIVAKVSKRPLYQIEGVKITKSEMRKITEIHNKVLERLMFTMLCIAKLNNKKNEQNNGWVNASSKEIFTCARISCSTFDRDVKIGKLWKMGLLEFPQRNDNLNCRVTFIDDEDEEELFVSDFRELGYEYLLYCRENFIRCKKCGALTRGNKNKTKKYCENCRGYMPIGEKKIVCVDCGKEFLTSSKNNSSCRCENCYAVYRKNRKLETQRERQLKQKVSANLR